MWIRGAWGAALLILASTGQARAGGATAPPVAVTFERLSAWSGGYGGQLSIKNLTTQPFPGWTLAFQTPDGVSPYNGTIVRSGNTCTLTPPSWSTTLAAGASFTTGYAGTAPGLDWTPPLQASFDGIVVPVTVADAFGGAQVVTFPGYENANLPVDQITLPQGASQVAMTAMPGSAGPFTASASNPQLMTLALAPGGTALQISSRLTAGGRGSVRITDGPSGKSRYLGIRIRNTAGAAPGVPPYVSVGVCSEDTAGDLGMFQGWGLGVENRRADNRYIYLNGGPVSGWWTWTANPGDRVRGYLHHSLQLGLIPTFVWYNIPDASAGYSVDLQHVQDASYMQAYFALLAKTLAIFNAEAPAETIMLVLEPDFLGFLMQQSGLPASGISAQVSGPARAAGLLKTGDPVFPDTVQGLVKAINYFIHRQCPQVKFGWQINVWASPDPVPGGSLMKTTDAQGWSAGRAFIQSQAAKVAAYYAAAGITSYASFISFDKYGFDAGGADGDPADPARGDWFWNSDHWNNYLLYVKTLHARTGLPAALWQLPVGRINASQAADPYTGGLFPALGNTVNSYEDSSATWFFGDRFIPGSSLRQAYFASNRAQDPGLVQSGGTLIWPAHFAAAGAAGVFNVMFGDGVPQSTRARPDGGAAPTDGWWLMTALQRYLVNPAPLPAP